VLDFSLLIIIDKYPPHKQKSVSLPHQRLKRTEALPNASREMGNDVVPNPPEGISGKLAETTTGLADGTTVGIIEGTGETTEGSAEGNVEGITEGCSDGDSEDDSEGDSEASTEGDTEGNSEENAEGVTEGNTVGSIEGKTEGSIEGILEGSRDGDTDGKAETAGGACSEHVHLATGNTVLPSTLAKAPLDGSRSKEYIKIGKFVSSGKKRSSAVPASHGKVSTSNSWYQAFAGTSRASKSLKPLNQSGDGAIIVIVETKGWDSSTSKSSSCSSRSLSCVKKREPITAGFVALPAALISMSIALVAPS
jgi:hypothetical protein